MINVCTDERGEIEGRGRGGGRGRGRGGREEVERRWRREE